MKKTAEKITWKSFLVGLVIIFAVVYYNNALTYNIRRLFPYTFNFLEHSNRWIVKPSQPERLALLLKPSMIPHYLQLPGWKLVELKKSSANYFLARLQNASGERIAGVRTTAGSPTKRLVVIDIAGNPSELYTVRLQVVPMPAGYGEIILYLAKKTRVSERVLYVPTRRRLLRALRGMQTRINSVLEKPE